MTETTEQSALTVIGMRRELKFRAWDGTKSPRSVGMIYRTFYDRSWYTEDNIRIYGARRFDRTTLSVMQFTGLKDIAGKEIYEGDIVECELSWKGGALPHAGVVVFCNTYGAFATKNESGETLLHKHLLNTFKIIGNIYQKPELLIG
ncbi:MAG: hypothetical protein GXP14_08520 [Gammaproteobacteria bacterium]|nr:hypothetical protein [Gammaproteobacteria bacterium]